MSFSSSGSASLSERAANSAAWARNSSGCEPEIARQPQRPAGLEGRGDRVRLDVEVVRVGVVEGGADVVPVVAQRGLDVLVGGDHDVGVRRAAGSSSSRKRSTGSSSATSGRLSASSSAAISASSRCSAASSAAGAISTRCALAQRALGERREPAQRLDLDVEQLDADRALLGRRVDVEQAAADRELAAVLDLVDALVAGRDELEDGLVEVEQLADLEREAVRAQLGVGHLLRQRDGGDDDDRGFLMRISPARRVDVVELAVGDVTFEDRVQRRDPQPDEVRRRGEVRLVGDAAARVEAHRPRAQPGAQVGGEVARGAVVAGHHHGRAAHVAVGDGRDQERPQRLRDERRRARLLEPSGVRVVLEVAEEGAEGHPLRVYEAAAPSPGRAPTPGGRTARAGRPTAAGVQRG